MRMSVPAIDHVAVLLLCSNFEYPRRVCNTQPKEKGTLGVRSIRRLRDRGCKEFGLIEGPVELLQSVACYPR